MLPEVILRIERSGDRLLAHGPNMPAVEIFPASETNFFFKFIDAQIEFVKDDAGKVTHLVIRQAGRTLQAKRLE